MKNNSTTDPAISLLYAMAIFMPAYVTAAGNNNGLPDRIERLDERVTSLGHRLRRNNGDIADNFSRIMDNQAEIASNRNRILALEGNAGMQEFAIDCAADADALRNVEIQDNSTYVLSGICNGPVWLEGRINVTFAGDGSGDKDDGVMLPSGLTEHPYGALGIWRSTGIRLENLLVSSANYVSQSYSFGDNVSSLSAGNQSHIDASDVDFIGGDYSVSIYNGSQLDLREGVQVIDFNRSGLDAYNQALIRTHEYISVSGIVGSSTETYPYAIVATNNSTVEIRNGGDFIGASGQPVVEYPTAVWSGDNSTIRFRNGSNPTMITGSIESAYSSMVRIDGNMTLLGALAAYHIGYIRATDTTQSGGEVYAGDSSNVRLESSDIAPSSVIYPCCGFEAYRLGNIRLNNTSVDTNGNPIYVSGFGIFDARGNTDLGGAEIFCHDANQIRIRSEVTNAGPVSCF